MEYIEKLIENNFYAIGWGLFLGCDSLALEFHSHRALSTWISKTGVYFGLSLKWSSKLVSVTWITYSWVTKWASVRLPSCKEFGECNIILFWWWTEGGREEAAFVIIHVTEYTQIISNFSVPLIFAILWFTTLLCSLSHWKSQSDWFCTEN